MFDVRISRESLPSESRVNLCCFARNFYIVFFLSFAELHEISLGPQGGELELQGAVGGVEPEGDKKKQKKKKKKEEEGTSSSSRRSLFGTFSPRKTRSTTRKEKEKEHQV